MSTIKDVAARAGVSVPTVYKVFSSTQHASEAVEKKVFDAAKELGYVHKAANKAAQTAGREKQGRMIGIVIDDYTNPFYGMMVSEIRTVLERMGHELVVLSNKEDRDTEDRQIRSLVDKQIDAIIFIPTVGEKLASIERLIAGRYPLLQLFRPLYEGIDTILIDDELGAYLAVKQLLQFGHRRIMLITRTNPLLIKREAGYRRAYEEAGIPIDEACISIMTYSDNIKEILKENIERISPTAIVSVGERISVNTIQALREMRLSIPDDISLIVYDDLPWTKAFDITAVSHSFVSIGNTAAELILNRMEEQGGEQRQEPAKLVLDPRLISRGSVKNIV